MQTPVAYLNCNFPAPVGEGTRKCPATFSHDDVITLFHECGHGLHHLLTQVDELPCPASTASNGTRSNCPASSWKTSAGNGTCSPA
jgi:Zn-dependent oligopeptidase